MDTREITRIVATNTARIDLPIWLRSEPYPIGYPIEYPGNELPDNGSPSYGQPPPTIP